MKIDRSANKYSEQDILNLSFSEALEKLQFVTALQDPSRTSSEAYRLQKVNGGLAEIMLAYDVDDNPIYVGQAHPSTATSDTQWLIRKLTWTDGNVTRLQVATGSWDNRAALF